MKIHRTVVLGSLVCAALVVGGLADVASAAVATTTAASAKNPLGNTPGKVVITGKVRATTGMALPTGMCSFVVDTTTVGTRPVNSRGNCSLTTHVKLGRHTVKISYGGSATFAASAGAATIDVTR